MALRASFSETFRDGYVILFIIEPLSVQMAIYRCEPRIIGREKRGRSVVAASAYRSGRKLKGEREGVIHDYLKKGKEVVKTAILYPDGSPAWVESPATLWNTVEAGEKRTDAQLAREFILALPRELNAEEQFEMATSWVTEELVGSGMIAEVSVHHPRSGKNPHAHVLCTMRKLDGNKFSTKKATEWNDVSVLLGQRESWADTVNAALEKAGRAERVDHRSLKERGIDRIPEPKIGVAATAMKRRGAVEDPERIQQARHVRMLNEVMPQMRAVQNSGEVSQQGAGDSWWERSIVFLGRACQKAQENVLDSWRIFFGSKRANDGLPPPGRPGEER